MSLMICHEIHSASWAQDQRMNTVFSPLVQMYPVTLIYSLHLSVLTAKPVSCLPLKDSSHPSRHLEFTTCAYFGRQKLFLDLIN